MIYYIYTNKEEALVDEAKAYLTQETITYVNFEKLDPLELEGASHLLVTGSLDEIKQVLALAYTHHISVGIVPSPKQKELMRTFALPSSLEEALRLALTPTQKPLDILFANNQIVLQEVVVGDAPPLDRFDTTLQKKTYLDRVKLFFHTLKKVKTLKHTPMKITDANSNEIKLSAVGVVGIEYHNNTFASKLIASQLLSNDGKLVMLILSPSSMLQYMGYLFQSLVAHLTPKALPSSVGFLRSSKLQIETKEPLGVLVDATPRGQTPVMLEVKERALSLSVGDAFWEREAENNNGKDSIKVDHLPQDEARIDYLSQGIPLFSHASKAQYASLFSNLREEARLSSTFMILLLLATMIATFGLFINSGSVIIGAMLLAPLMQPIVSVSMGVLRQDEALLVNGFKTIGVGVIAVLLMAAMIASFIPIEQVTSEMSGRLSPTLLDLFVAIISGVAAAYAKSNEKIVGSLAGVAIAVALVPPIAVAGIGLGWGAWHMFSMAFLLFVTNLVGIVLAAALTFMFLGFSPLHLAKKGVAIWLGIVLLISVPLYASFSKMKEDIKVQKTLSNLAFSVGKHDIKLTHVELKHHSSQNEIRCEVITTGGLSKEEKARLKEAILKSVSIEAEVVVTFRYRL